MKLIKNNKTYQMKTLKISLFIAVASLLFGCSKPDISTQAPELATPKMSTNRVASVNTLTMPIPPTPIPVFKAIRLNVYAIKFDTQSTQAYNLCIIRVINKGVKDSITTPIGVDYSIPISSATLDTISNHRLMSIEDSAVITLHIKAGDTISYSLLDTNCHIAPLVAANFTYTGIFKKIFEAGRIAPTANRGNMSGIHMDGKVNTIFIP